MRKLELLVNRNCNLKCDYCGIVNNTTHEKTSDTKRGRFLGILEEKFSDCYVLGGEPSINPDFIWILEQLHYNNIKIFVYSNSKINPVILNESLVYKPNYILSYHPNQMGFVEFIKNVMIVNKLQLLDTIVCMWSRDMNSLKQYKLFKRLFPDIKVYLEPIFDVEGGVMNIENFVETRKLGIEQHSHILNIKNPYINKTINDMYIDGDEKTPKSCVVRETHLTYDYQKMSTFRCLTDCMEGVKNESDVCMNTYCLCDVDKVRSFL